MPVTLRQATVKFKDSTSEYIAVNTVAQQTTADMISDVEDAGAVQVAAVEAAGASAIAALDVATVSEAKTYLAS